MSALEGFARSSRAQSYTLTAFVADSNGYSLANALVAWASDDTAVATVFDGVVTPVADSGTTTIRATAERRARRPGDRLRVAAVALVRQGRINNFSPASHDRFRHLTTGW